MKGSDRPLEELEAGREAMEDRLNGPCGWHENDTPIEDVETEPGCPNCGRLLEWKTCEGCHKDFLDWSVRTFDDVISGPTATSGGDLVCIPCGRREAEAEERENDYDVCDYEPFDSPGPSAGGKDE
jgi:hypothetical protein